MRSCDSDIDPYWMAASAIDEALRQIIAVGGSLDRVALLDNFCWGNTNKPERLGTLVLACRACYDMSVAFGTPFISGKDSLNNEFHYKDTTIAIPDTLLISAMGVMKDSTKAVSMDFKKEGDLIYIVGTTYNELGGSEYFKSMGYLGNDAPKVNPQQAKKIMDNFNKTPKSILLGTEMAFSFIENKIKSSAIISLDGLFSIPSFNMSPKIIHLIEKLVSITERKVIIQTRIPENKILQSITSGNLLSFLREDISERKKFGYPPFKRLIKITFEGSAQETEKTRNYLEKSLNSYDPQIFSAFVSKIKGSYITNTVLKVEPQKWPLIERGNLEIDSELFNNLYNLPPSFSINIDPEDLL